jgi:pilus assembly protein Flp/PilA
MKKRLSRIMHRLFWEDSGATAIEYAVMASLISVAVVSSVAQVASRMKDSFNKSGAEIGKSLGP